jgi:hypothetical protein
MIEEGHEVEDEMEQEDVDNEVELEKEQRMEQGKELVKGMDVEDGDVGLEMELDMMVWRRSVHIYYNDPPLCRIVHVSCGRGPKRNQRPYS